MSESNEKWIDGLQYSSLLWPPPQDETQRQAQILAYVEYFGQFTSDQFPDDIAQLIQSYYPSKERRLIDEVLATFVLHHPEHGHAITHPILSRIIDGTLTYDRNGSPFNSFIALFSQTTEKEYSEQWALACGEILRVLTHYNRPIYKTEHQNSDEGESSTSSSNHASTSGSKGKESDQSAPSENERKPFRPLSPWITDILLAAPLGIRSDYFRWCGGVMGKYAAGGELKPPMTACSRGSGKHPQLMPSTPRWAVANGAGVILSVCDEEVARYETANLTAAAVPALLLPPPTTPLDEHLVAGLPPLEPYARLFHRYYAIATPSATQRLLLGLLEAPPSWAPDALDAAVQLVELLRAAEDYANGMRLPRNWMHLHFLRAIGTAMSMRAGIAADAAAALLFRILSQPTLLFPPLRLAEGIEVQHEPLGGYISSYKKQLEVPTSEATIDSTAQGIASLLCAHGPEVEWRICTIWEAAYGLLPLSSSAIDLPEIVVATPLQPPTLSWSLYLPLLKVLEYLPRGSPSEACLIRIFVATVEAILRRTFPIETSREHSTKSRSTTKNLAASELRTMIHSLFLESCASMDLASRLLFVLLTVSVSHETLPGGSKKPTGVDFNSSDESANGLILTNGTSLARSRNKKRHGPVATFDSYVLAAVFALSCELQLFPLISKNGNHLNSKTSVNVTKSGKGKNGITAELQTSIGCAIMHTRRMLGILEALFSLKPSSVGTSWSYSSDEIVAAAMVAAHVSELFRRSKACMNALSSLMQCKWDPEISTRASSLYHLIDLHGKTVSSIVNKVEPLEATLVLAPLKRACTESRHRSDSLLGKEDTATSSERKGNCPEAFLQCNDAASTSGKAISSLPMEASDLANFLTMDRNGGYNCRSLAFLRSILAEKQELCFSVVSLLWHKLIAAPETKMCAESTSAHQGWRKVVDAICDVVSASPAKASTAIVLQAEKDLQPWIARDDEQGQSMWRVNQRIVKLIVELMRIHDSPEALIILASASDLLLRATDGMLVDGEACTLPQLELLEVTARAVHLVVEWGEAGIAVADGLSNLLKCRLSATIRCLSHPSAHVRALSMSLIRDIMHKGPVKTGKLRNGNGINGSSSYKCLVINWQKDIERCIDWEARSRRATGLTLSFLDEAAKQLGFFLG
ncbi:Protein GIGANTEA [Carex littledalei]|uniref:Protein GIGANTEA n=1 Tax=Carex littledalei TaxID=544730 RepID=A0A833VKK8_9POAL|nr:Protein GIGANTEA [Carex littledalei]